MTKTFTKKETNGPLTTLPRDIGKIRIIMKLFQPTLNVSKSTIFTKSVEFYAVMQ